MCTWRRNTPEQSRCEEKWGAEKLSDAGLICGDVRILYVERGSVCAEQALVDGFLVGVMKALCLRSTFLLPNRGI